MPDETRTLFSLSSITGPKAFCLLSSFASISDDIKGQALFDI